MGLEHALRDMDGLLFLLEFLLGIVPRFREAEVCLGVEVVDV